MDVTTCFICAESCNSLNSSLINLQTKKFKSKYTELIGNLINSEYELRISNQDKICEKCSVLIERFDELQNETKTVKSVLSRQIAYTYSIETDEQLVYMDKTKVFSVLCHNPGDNTTKYSCKICPRYVVDNIDKMNTHIVYHQIATEKDQGNKTPAVKKSQIVNTRESQEPVKKDLQMVQHIEKPADQQFQINNIDTEFEEDSFESLIDLKLLEDPFYDSNLKDHKCTKDNCEEKFTYASDYIRHIKLKHKFKLNHIFAAVKANLKQPNVVGKYTCPYCFTNTRNSDNLEMHVKMHEEAAKSNLFIDRINDFVTNVMRASHCSSCDCEISSLTALECNHQVAKNKLIPKISCTLCSREFYKDKLYNNHLALDHGLCFVCGSSSEDKFVLADHIRSHVVHTEYSCPFCKDIYQTKENRLDHIKSKHTTHCCTHCELFFTDNVEQEHHLRYAHADKRCQVQKPSICDLCGATFKNKKLLENHTKNDHRTRKIFTCSACREQFSLRYMLMDHVASFHKRTIVDNETNFYKCCFCMKGYSSQNRKLFVQHLSDHQVTPSFCYDCNINLESTHHLEVHREHSHQDFSKSIEKKTTVPKVLNTNNNTTTKTIPKPEIQKASSLKNQNNAPNVHLQVATPLAEEQIEIVNDPQTIIQDQPQQQILVQSEDGSLVNMNNFILTENGELIIQNFDGLLPNGQEGDENTQIQISNLEQFLMDQGLSSNVSYIQSDMITDDAQVIIQNDDGSMSQSTQESLLQTYKEIFEPDDEIPTELIGAANVQKIEPHSTQNLLLNGDYIIQTTQSEDGSQPKKPTSEQASNSQALEAANQSTLDELGDILLEVAAAAEKIKKPKIVEQRTVRETLWGKKRSMEPLKNDNAKRRGKQIEKSTAENETPARDFSQAYEFFVKGFDVRKQKPF